MLSCHLMPKDTPWLRFETTRSYKFQCFYCAYRQNDLVTGNKHVQYFLYLKIHFTIYACVYPCTLHSITQGGQKMVLDSL